MSTRALWLVVLTAIIALGILSRAVHLGHQLWDKYLGDALYAAMVYVLLRLLTKANPASLLVTSSSIMLAIEVFQLTGVPAAMLTRPEMGVKIIARLLGTHFSFLDLFAYIVGIGCVWFLDRLPIFSSRSSTPQNSI
jgi:hypothetical protein